MSGDTSRGTPAGAEALLVDELTALPNRRWIVGMLPGYFVQLRAAGSSLSLALLDVDGLARVNEAFGREAGDELLKAVAGKLAANCGSDAVAARYAGDEFLVLLPDTEEFFARIAAEELVAAVSGDVRLPAAPGEEGEPVSLSAGVASCPHDATSLAGLYSCAKDALYLAKRRGRGAVATAEDAAASGAQELDPFSQFPCPRPVGILPQLESVIRAAESVAPGEGRLVLVQGPPGVGKTRFLGEVAASLIEAGKTVLQASCRGGEDLKPFSASAALIENHVRAGSRTPEGVMRALPPQQAVELARMVGSLAGIAPSAPPVVDDLARRRLAFASQMKVFEGVSHERTLIVVLDEADWADTASLELLSAVARSPEVALLVVASLSGEARPVSGEVPFNSWYESAELSRSALGVKLDPLVPSSISAMVDALLPGREADADADLLISKLTAGFPLAVEELVKGCLASGLVNQVGLYETARAFTGGGGLEAVLDARILSMEETDKDVVLAAGASGGWADLGALEELTGRREGEILEAAEHLMREGVIRPVMGAEQVAFGFYSPVMAARCGALAPAELMSDAQSTLGAASISETDPEAAHLSYRLAMAGLRRDAESLRLKLKSQQEGLSEAVAQQPPETGRPERPKASTKELSDAAREMMKPLMERFVDAVREGRNASARDTATLRVVGELIATFEEVLDEVGVLTLSGRQNAMRANGVLLGVRPYGDAPSLVGGILRRKGIDVLSIDSSVKIDELVRLIHILSQDVPPVTKTDEYEAFLDGERIYHIAIQPARLMPKNTEVPYLPEPAAAEPRQAAGPPAIVFDEGDRSAVPAAGDLERKTDPFDVAGPMGRRPVTAGRTASYEGPPTAATDEVKRRPPPLPQPDRPPRAAPPAPFPPAPRPAAPVAPPPPVAKPGRGGRRRAIFETNVGLLPSGLGVERPRDAAPAPAAGAPPAAGGAAVKGIPEGDGPLQLAPEIEKVVPQALRDLISSNELGSAARLVKRLLMGFPEGDDAGRMRLANFLLRGIELFLSIREAELEKALERILAKELAVEENAGTAEMLAECARECVVSFVGRGSFHAAGHLTRALAGAKAASARSVLDGLSRTDIFDSLLSDIESGDPQRIQNAAVVLASMGDHARRPLIEMIRRSDDYRVRAAAAFILKEVSGEPPKELRSSMGPSAPPEERVRIISVADRLGFDLASLAFELMLDPEATVREAALKLARRLDAESAMSIVRRLAEAGSPEALAGAFELIGDLKLTPGLEILSEHLPESSNPGVMAEGARALGRIARTVGVAQPKSVRLLQAVLAKCLAVATPAMAPVAMEAVRALGEHDAPEATAVLKGAQAYPASEVAGAAARLCEGRE